MRMSTRIVALLAMSFFIGRIDAQPPKVSIQAGLNYSNADTVFIGGHNLVFDSPPTLRDSFSGLGARVGVTMPISDWATVEFGWAMFGPVDKYNSHFVEFTCPDNCPGSEGSVIDNVEQRGNAAWLAFVPGVTRDRIRYFGKIGVGRTTIESRQASDSSNRIKESTTEIVLGAGVEYTLTDRVGLRADLERLGGRATQLGFSLSFMF